MKKIIACVILLISFLLSPAAAYASDIPGASAGQDSPVPTVSISITDSGRPLPPAAGRQVYALNANGPEFILTGNTLTVSGLPEGPEYGYVWLRLCDAGGEFVFDEIKERAVYGGGDVDFEIAGIGNGIYDVEVFFSSVRDSTYNGLVWGDDVRVKRFGGGGEFLIPDMYLQNKKEYEAKRADLAALSYYLLPSRGVDSDNASIIQKAAEITGGISGDYEKVKAIHDWVADNIYYDMDVYEGRTKCDRTASFVLAARRNVCEGYANLTAALCRAAGIPAKTVHGYGKGSEGWPANTVSDNMSNHAWSEVFADGRWMIIDTTWNSDNVFEYGAFAEDGGLGGHKYFDSTLESFSANHYIQRYGESEVSSYAAARRTATPFDGTVSLLGEPVDIAAYNIGGNNYIKLRDIADELNRYRQDGISVAWNGGTRSVEVTTGNTYLTSEVSVRRDTSLRAEQAVIPDTYLIVDGEISFAGAYSIKGNTYLKLRDLAELFGFEVTYDAANKEVGIIL